MITLLRIVRAVLGVVASIQLITILPAYTWVESPDAVTGNMLAVLVVKALLGLVCLAAFAFLQGYINGRYARATGRTAPLLKSAVSL